MSEKPLAQRLQVKAGRILAVLDAPAGFNELMGAVDDVSQADVVLAFTPDRAALDAQLAELKAVCKPSAIIWAAYPKLTSPLAVDLQRETVRTVAWAHGLDTVSQIAVDTDWSAMRLKRV